MRRFFAPPEQISDGLATIDEQETRHLRDVLRLQAGSEVSVFDGRGNEYLCRIRSIKKRSSELEIIEKCPPAAPESPFEISLAAAVLNGEKYDLVVQKSVELGVKRLIPLETIRCDVKVKDAKRRLERWRRIAMEATKQCGRAKVMEIAEPVTFEELTAGSMGEPVAIFSERDGKALKTLKPGEKITAMVGPKGGWDDSELKVARTRACDIVTLGGRILRAETAAISITTILQHRFGDLN